MLLIVFCFGTGIRAVHCLFFFGTGIRVAHVFLFWEADPCCSSFFCFGRGSVLLIVSCFGRGFVLLIVFCFGREIRFANRFVFVLGGGSVSLIVF